MIREGRDAEDDRISLRSIEASVVAFRGARARIAWCMVGTAVYQVGRTSSHQEKNFRGLNPGAQ